MPTPGGCFYACFSREQTPTCPPKAQRVALHDFSREAQVLRAQPEVNTLLGSALSLYLTGSIIFQRGDAIAPGKENK